MKQQASEIAVGSLPEFPSFKALELSDRAAITSITAAFEPYSDFNFVSLWCWDVESDSQVAVFDDNLVLSLGDYLTGERFLTVIGSHVTPAHLHSLLGFAKATDRKPRLELIPDCVARELAGSPNFLVREDPDNADYILSASDNAALAGKRFAERRRLARLFEKCYGEEAEWRARPLAEARDLDLLAVFDNWAASRASAEDVAAERGAITRLEAIGDVAPLDVIDVGVGGQVRGFSVIEDVGAGVFLVHFEKADRRFKGLPSRLAQAAAQHVVDRGGHSINIEQDLGIAGLRKSKRHERPVAYLRKYIVEAS